MAGPDPFADPLSSEVTLSRFDIGKSVIGPAVQAGETKVFMLRKPIREFHPLCEKFGRILKIPRVNAKTWLIMSNFYNSLGRV